MAGISIVAQPRRQRLADDRGNAGRTDERARTCRALRRRHAEAVVDQQHDADLRRLRRRARRLGALGLQDGLRHTVARAARLGLLRATSSAIPGEILGHNAEQGQAAIPLATTGPSFRFPQATLAYFQFVFAGITPILMLGLGARPDQLQGLDPVRGPVVVDRLHRGCVLHLGRRLLRPARRDRLLRWLRDPPVRRRVRASWQRR